MGYQKKHSLSTQHCISHLTHFIILKNIEGVGKNKVEFYCHKNRSVFVCY